MRVVCGRAWVRVEQVWPPAHLLRACLPPPHLAALLTPPLPSPAVTLADIQIYAFVTYYLAAHELKDRALTAIDAVPTVKDIVAAVAAIPAVAAWEAGRAARNETF